MTLFELFGLLRKHLRFVITVSIVCTVVTAIGCCFLPNKYTATTTMYVLSKSDGYAAGNVATQSDRSHLYVGTSFLFQLPMHTILHRESIFVLIS